MIIKCENCQKRNVVQELQELKDIEQFTNRFLIIGNCRCCGKTILELIEIRKKDNVPFVDKYFGTQAEKIIKREKSNLKFKVNNKEDLKFYGWVYGINKDIRNSKGKIIASRQYSSDFVTNRTHYEKEIKKV